MRIRSSEELIKTNQFSGAMRNDPEGSGRRSQYGFAELGFKDW